MKLSTVHIPLRVKIAVLIFLSLLISLVTYGYLGSTLIINDKTSYIYDFTLTGVNRAKAEVENRVNRALDYSRLGVRYLTSNGFSPSSYRGLKRILGDGQNREDLPEVRIIEASGDKRRVLGKFGKIDDQRWDQIQSVLNPTELGKEVSSKYYYPMQGVLVILGFLNQTGERLRYVSTLLKLPQESNVFFISPLGEVILSPPHSDEKLVEGISQLAQGLFSSELTTGASDWEMGDTEYLYSYEVLSQPTMMIMSLLDAKTAFSAARTLRYQTTLAGIGILMLALGIALLFGRQITGRLREIWQVTQGVADGNFEIRVPVKEGVKDEISDLSSSFNVMADKIGELMQATADKAKLEKELETAQEVQNLFFPKEDFYKNSVRIAGRCVTATQCGGDWWYVEPLDKNRVVVGLGDVTGHGVSAALLTSVAFTRFLAVVQDYERDGGTSEDFLRHLIADINRGFFDASRGISGMTYFVGVLDLVKKEMLYSNCSHRPPLVYRKREGTPENLLYKNFKAMMGAQCDQIGLNPKIEPAFDVFKFEKNDEILIYSDGLIEAQNEAGQEIGKTRLRKILAPIFEHSSVQELTKLRDEIYDRIFEFLGEGAKELEDDITVVMIGIE